MASWKESMINRLSNLINRNRSAAKISQVLCSNCDPITRSNVNHISLFVYCTFQAIGHYSDYITHRNVHNISLFVYHAFQAIGHVCEECGMILTGELFTLHGRVLCEEDFKVWMVMIVLLLMIMFVWMMLIMMIGL